MSLPSLEKLAYAVDEEGDHPGGGHCAGLGGGVPEEDRRAMVEQYSAALDVLVDSALATGDGWSLSRPILFTTHHLCELALNLVLERTRLKGKQHTLATQMMAAVDGNALDHLTGEEQQWCQEFITAIVPITGNGFPGRYAQAAVEGVQLDELWCCVSPEAVRDAAITFAALCLTEPQEIESV
ncbi:hypothetical protein [Promicromonospora soli]